MGFFSDFARKARQATGKYRGWIGFASPEAGLSMGLAEGVEDVKREMKEDEEDLPESVTPATPLPTEEDPEVLAAKEEERRRLRLMRGRKGTILTGSQGLTEPAPVLKKTLLGA